jgi:hypothetical protein
MVSCCTLHSGFDLSSSQVDRYSIYFVYKLAKEIVYIYHGFST